MKYFAPEYEALLIKAQDVITSSQQGSGNEDIETPEEEC